MATLLVGTGVWMSPKTSNAFIPPDDRTIDLKQIQVALPPAPFWEQKQTFVTYLPTDMGPTTNQQIFYQQFSQGIQNRITQRLTDYLLKTDMFKDSGVSKTVDQVQKVAQTSAVIQSSPGGIQHKFNFQVQAANRTAVASYEGYFKLTSTYYMDNNLMAVALVKDLSRTTSLALTNTSPAGQFNQTSMLMLSHTF